MPFSKALDLQVLLWIPKAGLQENKWGPLCKTFSWINWDKAPNIYAGRGLTGWNSSPHSSLIRDTISKPNAVV